MSKDRCRVTPEQRQNYLDLMREQQEDREHREQRPAAGILWIKEVRRWFWCAWERWADDPTEGGFALSKETAIKRAVESCGGRPETWPTPAGVYQAYKYLKTMQRLSE